MYKGLNQVPPESSHSLVFGESSRVYLETMVKVQQSIFFGLFVQRIGLLPSKETMGVRFTHGPPNLALGVATSEDDCDTVTVNNFQIAVDLKSIPFGFAWTKISP